ncbi:MAG: hypothetical protein SFX73_13410 [Kofleriaceae bacterium]|nr:hypothetical protein [Kofleriaceae bacterium]
MDLRARLHDVLFGPTLEQELEECLATWPNPSPEELLSTREWIGARRHEFVELAAEIDDREELELSIAVRYIELKAHWMMLNAKIQYSLFRLGEAPLEVTYRASLVSSVIGTLEQLLAQDDIERITRFLAEPIERGVA